MHRGPLKHQRGRPGNAAKVLPEDLVVVTHLLSRREIMRGERPATHRHAPWERLPLALTLSVRVGGHRIIEQTRICIPKNLLEKELDLESSIAELL